MTTGAQAIVRGLEAAGVEVVFGLPGVHNLALWRALRDSPIRLVGVRHEQAAAYAADGYARTRSHPPRLGVALVTTGPGAANTLGAVGEAFASRSPVVVIATDVPTTLRREGVFGGSLHETTDQAAMFAPVTTAQVVVAPGGGDVVVAPGGGPVLVQVPTDLLDAETGATWTFAAPARRSADGAGGPLPEAERPLVWAGRDAVDRAHEVAALAEALGAPVVLEYAAKGLLPPEHPLLVGPPHVPAVGRLWDDADLVVAVGADLDGMNTQNWRQPAPPRMVQVGCSAAAAHSYPPGAVLEALPAPGGTRAPWADLDAVRAEVRAAVDPPAAAFLDAFAGAVPDDAVVVADMCIPGYWLAGFHRTAAPRRWAYPMGWGTLGFAFPAALGAALAHDGPTVAVCGDGGFLFACGELATAAQEALDLTVVVVDDGGYGMLRYDQQAKGDAPFGVDLRTPDFAALAASFGVPAGTVDGLDADFGAALAEDVATPGSSLLVARAALAPPPTTSPRWYRTGAPAWA